MTDMEATSEEQLDALKRDGRISPEDYDMLQKALLKGGVESTQRRSAATKGRLTKKWAGRQLGGVCAGLAEFFGLEPWSVRAAFVLAMLLTGGTAVFVYLVLYFTLPWSERDEVDLTADKKRRGGTRAFLASLIALWLFGILFHHLLVNPFIALTQNMGRPLPALILHLLQTGRMLQSWFGLGLQVVILGLVYLAYLLAPEGGAARRWLPRALILGVLLYSFFWLSAWVVVSTGLAVHLPAAALLIAG